MANAALLRPPLIPAISRAIIAGRWAAAPLDCKVADQATRLGTHIYVGQGSFVIRKRCFSLIAHYSAVGVKNKNSPISFNRLLVA